MDGEWKKTLKESGVCFAIFGGIVLVAIVIGISIGAIQQYGAQPAEGLPIADAPADAAGPMGWAGAESLEHTAAWAAQQPAFQLSDPTNGQPVWQDNAKARVCQWELQAALIGTDIPPNIPQQTGDCTSWGAKHAVERMQGSIGARGPPVEFKQLSSAWLYGAGRVWVANRAFGRGAGCSGAAIARAAVDYGVLPLDTPGLPAYSGALADKWGWDGPPSQFKSVAAQYRVKTVALLRTVNEVRDAVCNGFGVTIASSWGTRNSAMRVRDGRVVATRSGSWSHQMCIDGYDGSVPGKVYFHITNSWGPDAHPTPVDGSPPGGFWVESKEVEWILRADDTWAFSGFDGFPAKLDVSPIRPRTAATTERMQLWSSSFCWQASPSWPRCGSATRSLLVAA